MQREYTAQVAQGAESVSAQHKILLSSDTKPQGAHLINIHDKKCEYDEMLVKEHAERNITLQAFARVSYLLSSLVHCFIFLTIPRKHRVYLKQVKEPASNLSG